MTPVLSVRAVLARLSPEVGPLTAEQEAAAREGLRRLDTGSPWYLRVLMAFGAWIGSWFLLSFVFAAFAAVFGGEIEGVAVVFGVGLMIGAIGLRRASANDFLQQLALIVSLTGQVMFVGGVGAVTEAVEPAALAAVMMCVGLIAAFPDRVHRFLSTVFAVVALMAFVVSGQIFAGAQAIAIGLMALTLGLWRAAPLPFRTASHEVIAPVVAGAVVSLFGLLLTATVAGYVEPEGLRYVFQGGPTTAGAVLGLLWLVHEVMDEHEPGRFGVAALGVSAAIVVIAAITWRTPAILATMLIVALGFDRRSRTLVALAIAFFLAFGAFYYYNLSLTLLQKSGVLVGSGLVCLAGWAVARRLADPAPAEGSAS